MGCQKSRQKYIADLKLISQNKLDERAIENILMNTYYNEKQLLALYNRFQELGPDKNGNISNSQLMEMNEFKFCSFKKFLPKALKLNELGAEKGLEKPKRNVINVGPEDEEEEENKNNFGNNYANNFESILSINAIDSNNKLQPDNFNKETKFNQLILRDNTKISSDYVNLKNKKYTEKPILLETSPNEIPYITFAKFCDILKIFNSNYPVDMKIKFYFRLFDVDGDGKVSKKDLKAFLGEIFPEDIKKDKKNENEDVNEGKVDFDKLIEIVFGEIVYSEKRTYIDYDEFSQVMWTTNIDKSCSIDFEI